MIPPIRACVELEGSPKCQVIIFHITAPANAHNSIISKAGLVGRFTTFVIVSATALPPVRAPMSPNIDASIIACKGVADPHDIKVATTELASCKPLVKVKIKEKIITVINIIAILTVIFLTASIFNLSLFYIIIYIIWNLPYIIIPYLINIFKCTPLDLANV